MIHFFIKVSVLLLKVPLSQTMCLLFNVPRIGRLSYTAANDLCVKSDSLLIHC